MDLSVRRVIHGLIVLAMLYPLVLLLRGWYRGTLTREETYRLLLAMACLTIINVIVG